MPHNSPSEMRIFGIRTGTPSHSNRGCFGATFLCRTLDSFATEKKVVLGTCASGIRTSGDSAASCSVLSITKNITTMILPEATQHSILEREHYWRKILIYCQSLQSWVESSRRRRIGRASPDQDRRITRGRRLAGGRLTLLAMRLSPKTGK